MNIGRLRFTLLPMLLSGCLSCAPAWAEQDVHLVVGDTVRLERDGCPGAWTKIANFLRKIVPDNSATVVTVDNLKDLREMVGERIHIQEVFDFPQQFPDRYIGRTYRRRSWDAYPSYHRLLVQRAYTLNWRQLYRNNRGETFAAYVHTTSQNLEGVLAAVHGSNAVVLRNENGQETRVILSSAGQRLLVTQKTFAKRDRALLVDRDE